MVDTPGPVVPDVPARPSLAQRLRRKTGRFISGIAARVSDGLTNRERRVGRAWHAVREWDGRINLRRVLRATAFALGSVIVLGFALVLFLVYFPDTQIPEPETIDAVQYLDQGWGPVRESPGRELYYYTPQGASIRDLRYSWFANLERPWGQNRFADPAYLRALGFIVDPVPSHRNPDQLPVGFAKRFDERLQDYVLDITCAACHTGQLNITRGGRTTAIRIDGGQAMHAFTAMEIGHFLPVLLGSVASTYANPIKFNRFAWKVLGEEHYTNGKGQLRSQLWDWFWEMATQGWSDMTLGLYPTEEGFGRTDALARIGNTVFGDHVDPANYKVGNGPVSYPYLWNIWRFDWVQYNASVSQPMARNVGEAMGTGATYHLVDGYGRPMPAAERYRTSISFDNLLRIEGLLQQLTPPAWPEGLLGSIDRVKAQRGRALFQRHCRGCHGPHVAPAAIQHRDAPLRRPDEPLWTIGVKQLTDIGTDPNAALNFVQNRVDMTRTGLDPGYVRGLLERELDEAKARAEKAIGELVQEIARQRASRASSDAIKELEETLAEAKAYLPTDESIARILDAIDLKSMPIGRGLNILGLVIRERYYTEHRFTPDQRACYEGFGMLDLPQIEPGYKPRPLEGVWATPPFLHNGAVPTLYDLLSPADERPKGFWLARREFDPVKVGYMTDRASSTGGFWFDTRKPGNFNTGHEFRAGHVEYDETNPRVQYGVIGPALSPQDRFDLIEYLKIHKDPAPARARPPMDCFALLRGGQS
jgi:mono/diheme cytochrome c family protein